MRDHQRYIDTLEKTIGAVAEFIKITRHAQAKIGIDPEQQVGNSGNAERD